jgi:two-component system response regulator
MGRDIKIMLVEDNPEDVAFTKRLLKHNNLDGDLVVAFSGSQAMEALEKKARESDLPNLILLDINLPDISGIDLLTRIKQDDCFRRIPVVILTGSNEDEDIQRSYDLGATTYLVKPIFNDALMQVIDRLF